MDRLRVAGWLVFLTAWGTLMGMVIRQDARIAGLRQNIEDEFGFWIDVPGRIKLQLFFHLVLVAGAVVVGLLAALAAVGRVPLIVVSGLIALSALPAVVWNYFDIRNGPPESVRDLPIPVPGGRYESFVTLALAGAGLALALTAAATARRSAVGPPSTWGGPP
jgi:hypothetical protein